VLDWALRKIGLEETNDTDVGPMDMFTKEFLSMALAIPIASGAKAPIALPSGFVGGAAIQP
jgi:hypothetical protein